MTKREWKVGDRVARKREHDCTFPEYLAGKEYIVEEVDEEGDPRIPAPGNIGWFWAGDACDVFDVLNSDPASELDAIERDMADLFSRMRAAIERLK